MDILPCMMMLLTEKILNEDSQVEVSMTIQAYLDYNGRIYYTWKDDEAFRKIFKTGSFTDSEGMLAYALPCGGCLQRIYAADPYSNPSVK